MADESASKAVPLPTSRLKYPCRAASKLWPEGQERRPWPEAVPRRSSGFEHTGHSSGRSVEEGMGTILWVCCPAFLSGVRSLAASGTGRPRATDARGAGVETQPLLRLADACFRPVRRVFGVAAQRPQLGPVHVQHTVQVVRLMLHDPGLPAGKLPLPGQSVRRLEFEEDFFVAGNHCLQAVEGQTALIKGGKPGAQRCIAWVHDGKELQRAPVPQGSGLRIDVELILEDSQLQR